MLLHFQTTGISPETSVLNRGKITPRPSPTSSDAMTCVPTCAVQHSVRAVRT